MDRIAIIGCGGSGKSTVARQLARILNAPLTHLDAIYYDKQWNPLPQDLNYSAYSVGEIPYRQRDDSFMPGPRADWHGSVLPRHLVQRLDPGHPFVDLNIHNIWTSTSTTSGLCWPHDPASLPTTPPRAGHSSTALSDS